MKTQSLPRNPYALLAVVLLLPFTNTTRADYISTVLADKPIGYWPLNLNVDTNGYATDVSGNTNNGNYINIYSPQNEVPGPSSYITNGVTFDGATTFVDLSTGNNIGLLNFGGPITMEAWVQPANPSAGTDMDVIGKGDDTSQNYDEIEMRLDAGGGFRGGTYTQAAGDKGVTTGTQTTNWIYLVTTYDGTNWNLYVNGALSGTSPDTVGSLNFTDPWAIGNGTVDGDNRFLAGNLSQVALYTNALPPAQILRHYFVGLDGTTNTPPVIVQPPTSQSASPSEIINFSCQVESLLPTTNQWYFNGNPLPGQTNATLTLNDVQTNNNGNYSVVIGNSAGSTNSVAVSLTVVTQPTTIVWQNPQVISGASDVVTNGTYFASWAPYDGGANGLPVNGVNFQGFSDLPDFNNNFPSGNGGPYFSSPNTANANYNNLLEYATYANGASAFFSWGGMTAGHTYEVQSWVEDARNGITDARWENFSGGDGQLENAAYGTDTSAAVGYSSPLFSSPVGNPGYYITGSFVADSSGSEEILVSAWDANANNQSAQINLFQVRDITIAPPAQPNITGVSLSGTTLVLNGTNGTAGLQFSVLTSTNLTLPLSQWTPIATYNFTGSNFSVTNTVNPGAPQSFYILQVP